MVIIPIQKNQQFFTIVDKINGNNLLNVGNDLHTTDEITQFQHEAEISFFALACYLSDRLSMQGTYPTDIFVSHQWVYGSTIDSENKHVYIVDLDPMISGCTLVNLIYSTLHFSYMVADLESRTKIHLDQTKIKLLEIIDNLRDRLIKSINLRDSELQDRLDTASKNIKRNR